MENTFTSPRQLPRFADLLRERELRINMLINNLKLNDVKEDAVFQNTVKRIKRAVLLQPVVFGEPTFVDHSYEERQLSFQQQLSGSSSHRYTHTISVPFTGDNELFSYAPDNYSFSSSDRGLILPYSGGITVYVSLSELNPAQAISQAQKDLDMTFRLVEINNTSLQHWSKNIESMIDQQLNQKREQLINLFGNK
ncbi:hypothetical protein [Rudanella lutea]|uniref:hypothetical protein n=1 Tax=Rudanella lutea TaxID=451374 RepID=UPI00037240BB|nr:hypothetical protein [Rudanella lutea]